jgi:ribonuclease HII
LKKTAEKKLSRLSQLLLFDEGFRKQGFTSLAGVDEAGRGPWAGPVVASAVIVKDVSFSNPVDDSKKMTAVSRERIYGEILAKCEVGVGIVEVDEIDRLNILEATFQAMRQALERLGSSPDCVLVDGNRSPRVPYRFQSVIDGDARSFSIACASVVAKVTRDRMMDVLDGQYPQYGFAKHKGYGTREHAEALKKHGPCRIHRKSFEPVKKTMEELARSSELGARKWTIPSSDLPAPSQHRLS